MRTAKMIETTLNRFNPDREKEAVKVNIKWGKDIHGNTDWNLNCDKLNIFAHSSCGYSKKPNATIKEKLIVCKNWFKEMLNEKGYFDIEFIEVKN